MSFASAYIFAALLLMMWGRPQEALVKEKLNCAAVMRDVEMKLPNVAVLPLNKSLQHTALTKDLDQLRWVHNTHDHHLAYYHFVTARYNQTVRLEDGDVFFFPALYSGLKELDKKPFLVSLDEALERAVTTKGSHVVLDRTFWPLTHPLYTKRLRLVDSRWRNLLDLRLLRVDQDFGTNGRDVMVPYLMNAQYYAHLANWTDGRRNISINGFLREAGGGIDHRRQWRSKLNNDFAQWAEAELRQPNASDLRRQFVTRSRVTEDDVSGDDFVRAYAASDFCMIVPGDTSSTAKLFKALFSGCIPVVFVSFPQQLPFYHFVDWHRFSVVVYKDEIRSPEHLDAHLQKTVLRIYESTEVLRQFKRNVAAARGCFDFANFDWPSPYHLTLLEVATA